MNRRDFLKSSVIAGALTLFIPAIIAAAPPTPILPPISWKDFDWMKFPCELAFRLEVKDGKNQLVSTPYFCKTQKTKLVCVDGEPDLTLEKETVSYRYCIQREDEKPFGLRKEEMEVQTNPILLHEAKKLGFTHIYMFVKSPPVFHPETFQPFCGYLIRGAKMPDWKTNKGKLQIVNV